jgi:hypothetical protein
LPRVKSILEGVNEISMTNIEVEKMIQIKQNDVNANSSIYNKAKDKLVPILF